MTHTFLRLISIFFGLILLLQCIGLGAHFHFLNKISYGHQQIREEWGESSQVQELRHILDDITYTFLSFRGQITLGEHALIARAIQDSRQRFLEMKEEHVHESVMSQEHTHQEDEYVNTAISLLDQFLSDFDAAGGAGLSAMRPSLEAKLRAARDQIIKLQSFYQNAMSDAIARADSNLLHVRQLALFLSFGLIFLLTAFFAWFSYLLQRQAKLQIYQEKMTSLGLMASQLAHEIRNPLGIIKSAVSVLQKDQISKDEKIEMMRYMSEEADRINHLIQDLLQLRQSGQTQMADANISNIVQDVIDFIQPEILERGVEVRCHDQAGDVNFQCDAQGIRQMVLNLLLNALAVTPRQAVVDVSASVSEGFYRLVVRDPGPGFDRSVQARLFEPFVSTKKNGLGIGLSVVKRVIDDHQGTIDIRTSSSKGTEFTVQIPIKRKETSHA